MNSPSSAERAGDNSSEALQHVTAQLIRLLTEAQPIVLVGDEDKKSPHFKTGQRRILEDRKNLHFSVAMYEEDDREHMAEMIEPTVGGHAGLPMGHVQYESGEENGPGVSAMIYVGDEGITAQAIFRHDTQNPMSERAENHLGEASILGLGEQWAGSLLSYLRGEEPSAIPHVVPYEDWQIFRINDSLRDYTHGNVDEG